MPDARQNQNVSFNRKRLIGRAILRSARFRGYRPVGIARTGTEGDPDRDFKLGFSVLPVETKRDLLIPTVAMPSGQRRLRSGREPGEPINVTTTLQHLIFIALAQGSPCASENAP